MKKLLAVTTLIYSPLGPFLKRPRRWEDKEVVNKEKNFPHNLSF